jgi:16S rRNA (adenine1518-N6/adenine1519-N6)-dimethyltransferase
MEERHCIQDMHFMLQKEVVERITAQPGNGQYGRLSIMLQYYCQAEQLFIVSPGAFFPPPRVDSAVFRLIPRSTPLFTAKDEKLLSRVVSQSFSQRRKTIRNNLKGVIEESVLLELDIDPGLRPERLGLEQFVKLANWLADNKMQ